MSGYVYCVKFKDHNFIKIGKSLEPKTRCSDLGVVESIVFFRHTHYELMEGIFHNAFSDKRIVRGFLNSVNIDGATEYFTAECFEEFILLCGRLNIPFEVGWEKCKNKCKFDSDISRIQFEAYKSGYLKGVSDYAETDVYLNFVLGREDLDRLIIDKLRLPKRMIKILK